MHDDKEEAVWNYFTALLSIATPRASTLNLHNIMEPSVDMYDLDMPIS